MKLIATVLFSLLVGALADTWDPIEQECAEKQNLDEKWVKSKGDPFKAPIPTNDTTINTYLVCVWKKLQVLNKNDTINWDSMKKKIESEIKPSVYETGSNDGQIISLLVVGGVLTYAVETCREAGITGNSVGETIAKVENCVGEEFRVALEKEKTKVRTSADTWDPTEQECAEKQNLDEKWVKNKGDPFKAPIPTNDTTINTYLACVWKKLKVLNKDDTINWDSMKKKIESEIKPSVYETGSNDGKIISLLVVGGVLTNAVETCRGAGITADSVGETIVKVENCVGEEFRVALEKEKAKL